MFIAIFFAITTIITAIIMINADRLAASTVTSKEVKTVRMLDGQLLVDGTGRQVYFDKYTCPCCGEEVTSEAGQVQGEVLCAQCEYILFVGDDE